MTGKNKKAPPYNFPLDKLKDAFIKAIVHGVSSLPLRTPPGHCPNNTVAGDFSKRGMVMEAALTDRNSPIEHWMRLYWMARQRIADLIRCGEFEDSDRLLTKLAEAGSWLVEGSGAGRSLGKAILRATADLTNQYIETRASMAAELLRSIQ